MDSFELFCVPIPSVRTYSCLIAWLHQCGDNANHDSQRAHVQVTAAPEAHSPVPASGASRISSDADLRSLPFKIPMESLDSFETF